MNISALSTKVRHAASNLLLVLSPISTIFMLVKILSVLSDSPVPINVVTSESMEPAFRRGDLILIWNREPLIRAGDIPVVWIPGRKQPMVHRAIRAHYEIEGEGRAVVVRQKILTKGDNNDDDDRQLYPPGRAFVGRDEIVGVVRGYIPWLGWPTIALTGAAWLKAAIMTCILAVVAVEMLSKSDIKRREALRSASKREKDMVGSHEI
ncbi:MAG: hypothetical protein M1831_005759 [Alyxoria varia]|nr:MAG: hypothetical protein M1831_005759 [Alyxoria varia]